MSRTTHTRHPLSQGVDAGAEKWLKVGQTEDLLIGQEDYAQTPMHESVQHNSKMIQRWGSRTLDEILIFVEKMKGVPCLRRLTSATAVMI